MQEQSVLGPKATSATRFGKMTPRAVKTKVAGLVIGATLVSRLSVGVISYNAGRAGLIAASQMRLRGRRYGQGSDELQ